MIFYRGPSALITNEVFVSRSPEYQQFAIRELSEFHIRRRSAVEVIGASHSVRVFSAGLAGTAAVVALASKTLTDWPTILAVAVGVGVLACIAAVLAREFRGRHKQLWAIYRGEFVCIFSTADPRVFEQVTRSLSRAFEWIEEYA